MGITSEYSFFQVKGFMAVGHLDLQCSSISNWRTRCCFLCRTKSSWWHGISWLRLHVFPSW